MSQNNLSSATATVQAALSGGVSVGSKTYKRVINYDHIPAITYFPKAKANLVKVEVKMIGKNISSQMLSLISSALIVHS